MKIIRHDKKPDSKDVGTQLNHNPMRVFLTPTVELLIEKGDQLKIIALQIKVHWGVNAKKSQRIAALWFALGERRVKKGAGWTKLELSEEPGRRYLPKG
jgi:hypothetical protein